MVYAEFGGQTKCIMGNSKIENTEAKIENHLIRSRRVMKAVNYIELDWTLFLTLLLTPSLAILSWAHFRQILLVTPHNTQKRRRRKERTK